MQWQGYEVGKRVVCIGTSSWDPTCATVLPVKGRIYTIRQVEPHFSKLTGETTLGLRFEEFVSRPIGAGRRLTILDEWFFEHDAFKPVDESRLDVFRQHLVGDIWKQPVAA